MKYTLALCLLIMSLSLQAQVIRFQSAGGGGTTPSQASNGVITHFGMVSDGVSQGSGHSNQSGFFFANIDYRPAVQASALTFSSSSTNNTTFNVTVSWTNGNGARRLVLVREGSAVNATPADGTGYTANVAFGSGSEVGTGNYVVYDGIGTSVTVTGLTKSVYHFKVFEYNGKYASNNVNIVYQPGAVTRNPAAFSAEPTARPASLTFSDIIATSMTGTFPTTNATGFLILRREGSPPTETPEDGTSYSGTFGSSTVVHNGIEGTFVSAELSAATTYHYALYAYNGSGSTINYLSANPLKVSKITVPAAPTVELSNATSSNFNVEWTAMPSATGYRLDVSTEDDFSTFVEGYQDKDVSGTLSNVTGLQGATQYFVRVRALNESGASAHSETRFITTQAFAATPLSISVSQTALPTSSTVAATVTGGAGVRVIKFYSRGIRSTGEYIESPATEVSDGKYEVTVQHDTVSDALGLEFTFDATDASGAQSSTGYLYLPVPPNTVVPDLPFGGTASNYRIISIPYALNLNNSAIVFSSLGAYDKTQWRFLNWNGSSYVDNPSTISAGAAYWFNAVTKPAVTLGEGSVSRNNQSSPFALALKQGWNMIATPYPFAVNWTEVLEHNANPDVSDYYVFNGDGYTTSNNLEPWKGGFVFADEAVTVNIPVVAEGSSGGREGLRASFTDVPGTDENWIVPIMLTQGEHVSTLNAFGMHQEASSSKDRFDVVALPPFLDLPEFATDHEEYMVKRFVRDIVPHQQHHVWSFKLNASGTDDIELRWDNKPFRDRELQMLLHDPAASKLVDMRFVDRYMFPASAGKVIQFIFSDGEYISRGELATAYPNPFSKEINLPSLINTARDHTKVWISIRNLAGNDVFRTAYTSDARLIQPVWQGNDTSGNQVTAGVYIYQVTFYGNGGVRTFNGKVMKL